MLPRVAAIVLLLLLASPVCAETALEKRLREVVRSSGARETSVTVESLDGRGLFQYEENQPRKPASVLKLLLTAVVLREIGPNAEIPTDVFLNEVRNGNILALRGHGDPSFTTESAYKLAERVSQYGVRRVQEVLLDTSLWDGGRERTGTRAYNTGASPLAFNFNSFGVVACPAALGAPAVLSTDPSNLGAVLAGSVRTVSGSNRELAVQEEEAGRRYRVSGVVGVEADCAVVYRSVEDPLALYAAGIRRAFQSVGIVIENGVRPAEVPDAARPLFQFSSKAVALMLRDLNHFSTNFIAEQLLHLLGKKGDRYDREEGLARMHSYLESLHLPTDGIHLVDGSGLSHENRITTRALARVLRESVLDARIGPEFEASLSVAGESGTLEKRSFGPAKLVRGKTGSLSGVSSLVGYVVGRDGEKRLFAIISNDGWERARAQALEDRIVREIYEAS